MKQVKKIVCALMVAVLVFAMSTVAFAAENGSIWMGTTETSDSTLVHIVTDTTVTDGVIEITYDSSALTYKSVSVNDTYVAMHAVNAENPGSVKISWVAPEAYNHDGTGISLIQVNFEGVEEKSSVELSGTAKFADGSKVPFTKGPDDSELIKAILEAEGLTEYFYSEESFAKVTAALEEAYKVLESPISSQKDMDEAEKALERAVYNLSLKAPSSSNANADTSELEKAIAKAEGLDESKYTNKSFKDVEKELKAAKAVLNNSKATQSDVDAAVKALNDAVAALELLSEENNPNTGIESVMSTMLIVAAVSAMGLMVFGNKFMKERAR